VSARSLTLGYSAADLARSPYARFYKPDIAPLSASAREAVTVGALPHEVFAGLEDAARLVAARGGQVETGFTVCPDGETRVFDTTPMPRVTPAMWNWWFAWHGNEAARYKLWHPRAHVHVAWADGEGERDHYVGRTSHVVEYIGATRIRGSIRFVPPSSLGIDEAALKKDDSVCICARIGQVAPAIDAGWLMHHVFPVAGGSEMRSYFWLGGRHVASRGGGAVASSLLRGFAKLFPQAARVPATDLLVHCAQEMSHLAGLLPDIHAAFAGRGAERQEAAQ
jgi:hypothetical protein